MGRNTVSENVCWIEMITALVMYFTVRSCWLNLFCVSSSSAPAWLMVLASVQTWHVHSEPPREGTHPWGAEPRLINTRLPRCWPRNFILFYSIPMQTQAIYSIQFYSIQFYASIFFFFFFIWNMNFHASLGWFMLLSFGLEMFDAG